MNLLAKNLLILASAGSGKTFQLSNRIIGLAARGAPPERIVALTFTRKAAGEFTDALLTKLASAASNPASARSLSTDLKITEPDFIGMLRSTVRALPRVSFGTMDGFFAKIVKGFQYELGLTGGRFELLEGPRAAAIADDLLAEILGTALQDEIGETFFHAFRRSLIGREEQGVLSSLRAFVGRWQSVYQEFGSLSWGPAELAQADPSDWENHKHALAQAALDGITHLQFTDKRQPAALEAAILALEQHSLGSGSLGSKAPTLLLNLIEACAASGDGPLTVKFQKEFTINGPVSETLRRMIDLAARCEFATALGRTRAIRDVVAVFDALCAKRLRAKGMLGFNEVKLLMGEWVGGEDARLRREAVDFRLDSRHDHWLLDEFQDTSQAEWRGLQPLIDEAASGEDGSLFIVGDKKQAIYAWRGGDVGLFDEVVRRYGRQLEIEPMAESWRSSPELLSLVNRICGNTDLMRELFGDAASRWEWQAHVSAIPLQAPAKRGHALVEVVGDWEARLERMKEILSGLRVHERDISCGILLRGNNEVREVAEFLRGHDFDVIEEGQREPSRDNPAGMLILHLLKWLANPADSYSREVIAMSPLASSIESRTGSEWWRAWEALTKQIASEGFARSMRSWIAPLEDTLSEFGRSRTGDVLAQLSMMDSKGGVSIGEAIEWLEQLEIPQSPGSGAIQVMTIHKSKGLGFDVVIIPQVPDAVIPQSQHFDLAFGNGWVSQTPPKWARKLIPELNDAETEWSKHQRYEAFCLLYVALTRAKRGLYVLLDEPAKSADPMKASLARWFALASDTGDDVGGQLEFGHHDWLGDSSSATQSRIFPTSPVLPHPVRSRQIVRPSGSHAPLSPRNAHAGTILHRILESITWIDEQPPDLPKNRLGDRIREFLKQSELRGVFLRNGRSIELLQEQAIEISLDSQRVRAVIDRLHLHRDSTGKIHRVEIFDFKTDAETHPDILRERHQGQMSAYRRAMETLHPGAEIDCQLLSIPLGRRLSF